jgi:hypothetical protein
MPHAHPPPVIEPTDTCFDDALEFFPRALSDAGVRKLRDPAFRDRFRVVHGICIGNDTHAPYVHAWVEANGRVWQAGYFMHERVYFALESTDFYQIYNAQAVIRYTLGEVVHYHMTEGSTGPWDPELQRLIARQPHGEIVGHMQGAAPVAIITARAMPRGH